MTDTVTNTDPADKKSVEINGWLMSELVRQYNESVYLRQDLAQLLGVEFLMPEPPRIPHRIHSEVSNDAIRAVLPLISDGIKKSGVIATKVAAAMVEQSKQEVARTAVRRVERDEHGRIARIIDEAVPHK